MSFQQGLSGLNAAAKSLDTLGNNIANSGTVGFKSSSTLFGDVFAATLGGGIQVGIGVSVGGVSQQFSQGNLTVTSNPLDLAINGQGMFRLSNNGATTFTRNGQFNIDKDGFVVNTSGYRLTGYLANAANVIVPSTPAEIFINTADLQPQATGNSSVGARIGLNLDSRQSSYLPLAAAAAAAGTAASAAVLLANPAAAAEAAAASTAASTAVTGGATMAAAAAAASAAVLALTPAATAEAAAAASAVASSPTPAAAFNVNDPLTYNSSTSITVFDSLGNPHLMSLFFRKTAANNWDLYTNLDGGTASPATTLSFNSTGTLTAPAGGIIAQTHAVTTGATSPLTFNLNLVGSTQYGNIFGVNSVAQDGYTSGRLSGLSIAADGTIQGRYSNGQSRDLAQVVLANFNNPNGLTSLGNNQWGETPESGQPLVGVPGSGSLGALQSAAVEESNVDLTAELVAMITQQRAYQANAQTIKTQDQILQTLVNLR
ncbi:MAG: flagellar hook protein FlgE [Gammaproteobacteria bacterium]|nr:flagellar hook protein FlgE [Rhodocyclaceae bacterium]MBU3909523.1 flagellar hook protein FlgE [Gammaproteobacteria bacterium]MBU3990094.1 flagellar hook protein FlgE [Gammaproteobacteria bacterium]MBU4003186.1 flagellar hook protein FlgE [Gammaproteobacteria bacterium]MBU4022235.1 flagellar hook protein FlgE [Gammaproteobacteria bacterium]